MRLAVAQKGKAGWRRRGGWLMLALGALAMPRLLPAMPLGALDLLAMPAPPTDSAETADQNFPGSAFFFAEGAFAPLPGAQDGDSAHVYELDRSPAAVAAPFRGLSAQDGYRAANCLTSAIYYEAANEPNEGQRAVAQVVLNRVRHPAWPNSVCGVVYQGSERADMKCQFTFSCDGAMARAPSAAAWARARRVAVAALAGSVYAPAGLATHYHTLAVRPFWASSLRPVAVIGAHIFYRWQGVQGLPAAFHVQYTGRETQAGPSPRIWQPAGNAIALPPSAWGMTGGLAPTIAPAPATGGASGDRLPQSGIRDEYRDSGRPLI